MSRVDAECGCWFDRGELVMCPAHAEANRKLNGADARYMHACRDCLWLGAFDRFDLYWCPQLGFTGSPMPTLIARYGNGPSEYLTYNYRLVGSDPRHAVFAEALRLARIAGLET